MNEEDFTSLEEDLYGDGDGDKTSFMPNVPTGPIYPRVPTTAPLPTPISTPRNELVELRSQAYDTYVDVMHKTLQGFSKLTNCRRTKEVNDGVAKIKDLINKINTYDARLKSMSGGKRKSMKGKANKRTKKYKHKHIRRIKTRKNRK